MNKDGSLAHFYAPRLAALAERRARRQAKDINLNKVNCGGSLRATPEEG